HVLFQDFRPQRKVYNLHIYPPKGDGVTSHRFQLSFLPYNGTTIDLRAAANMSFKDDIEGDQKGGWTDQGPENDLRMLPVGKQRFSGTEFDIIDPAKNNGKSCLVLKGGERKYMPQMLETPVKGNVHGKWLFLLHARAWTEGGDELGTVTLTYTDGTTSKITPMRGIDAGNWWNPGIVREGQLVWSGTNASAPVGLYRSNFAIEDKPIQHIRFESAGNSLWLVVAATVGMAVPYAPHTPPYFTMAGPEWQPIDYVKDIVPGSALDFSWRQDKPAGKYGPIVIRNGHFEFRDAPGKKLRFYGTNLCFDANYLEHNEAELLADRIAALGFNIIRFHHHDGFQSGRPLMTDPKNSTKLNPDAMEKLDYLYYCLKQRGIYLTTDLYISRIPPKGTFAEYPGTMPRHYSYKAMFWIVDSVYQNWLKHATARLTHVNKYTGNALKDDPALITINIINEGNIHSHYNKDPIVYKMYMERYAKWLQAKGIDKAKAPENSKIFEQFLAEIHTKRYAQMVADLRKIGLKVPLCDQNMRSTLLLNQMRAQYDFVDNHFYINHPRFPIKPWSLPVQCQHSTQLETPTLLKPETFGAHLLDRPYSITEWDFCKPNNFRAEGPSITSTVAGIQDWSILVHFAYAHRSGHVLLNDKVENCFDISCDPMKHIVHRIGSALFLGKGIQPARANFVTVLDRNATVSQGSAYSNPFGQLGEVAKVSTLVVSSEEELKAKLPKDAILIKPNQGFPAYASKYGQPLDMFDRDLLKKGLQAANLTQYYDSATQRFLSEDGAVEHIRTQKAFRATADDCETIILPAKQKLQGTYLGVDNQKGRGVFGATSLDGAPIDQTSRVLLVHVTNCQASLARFDSSKMELMEKWGKTPFLVTDGQADVSLKLTPGPWTVWAIGTDGKHLAELPSVYHGGHLRFHTSVFNKFGQVFAYEIAK
ncbi:MAG: hypothetical protein IJJ26_13160, partial [Victivallales bacterium]|nr:hypothetical protein [Victivallales bacterium]